VCELIYEFKCENPWKTIRLNREQAEVMGARLPPSRPLPSAPKSLRCVYGAVILSVTFRIWPGVWNMADIVQEDHRSILIIISDKLHSTSR